MASDWIKHRVPDVQEPTPEEIRRALRHAKRLQAQAFRNIPRAVATGIARAFRRRAVASAPAAGATSEAHAV